MSVELILTSTLLSLGLTCSPISILMSPLWQTLSPEDFQEATMIEAPLSEVTVYHGHASALREGMAQVQSEGTLIRLPDLPHLAQEVKVSVKSAEVLRVVQNRRFRSNLDLKTLSGHVESLENIYRDAAELSARLQVPKAELALLSSLSPRLTHKAKEERLELSQRSQKMWQNYQKKLSARQFKAQRESATLTKELKTKLILYQEHLSAARAIVQQAQQRQVLAIYALIASAKPRQVPITVSYRLPNATWTATYELHVDIGQSVLKRNFGVKIKQNSGEDWLEVKLKVSTGDDLLVLTRPQIRSWLLSEEQQFNPRVTSARSSNPSAIFQAPAIQTRLDEVDQDKINVLKQRFHHTQEQMQQIVQEQPILGFKKAQLEASLGLTQGETQPNRDGYRLGEIGGHSRLSQRRKGRRSAKKRRLNPPPPAPPPPPPASARRSRATSAPAQLMETAVSFDTDDVQRAPNSRATQGLSLLDQTQYVIEDQPYRYRFTAPNPTTVISGSDSIIVPMKVHQGEVKLLYESTPALSPHAYLIGEVQHQGQSPILTGQASLFSGGSFIGETQLNTVLQGEKMTLHLGADPDIKVKRQVEIKSETNGVFSRTETNLYTVNLQVVNHKKRAVKIKLYDVLPVSDHKEVKVKLLTTQPSAEIEDKKSGIVSWHLSLKAGAKHEVKLQYQISHPADQRVYQR
jgi:hypothetical protein